MKVGLQCFLRHLDVNYLQVCTSLTYILTFEIWHKTHVTKLKTFATAISTSDSLLFTLRYHSGMNNGKSGKTTLS